MSSKNINTLESKDSKKSKSVPPKKVQINYEDLKADELFDRISDKSNYSRSPNIKAILERTKSEKPKKKKLERSLIYDPNYLKKKEELRLQQKLMKIKKTWADL